MPATQMQYKTRNGFGSSPASHAGGGWGEGSLLCTPVPTERLAGPRQQREAVSERCNLTRTLSRQ
jgi:hypothetical protein